MKTNSWEIAQKIPIASFSYSLLKVGITLVKINIFQRINAVSAVLTVFEMLNYIDFQGGNSTSKNETKTRQWVLLGGIFQEFFFMHRAYAHRGPFTCVTITLGRLADVFGKMIT